VREAYLQRMEVQIREVNRELDILQARAEMGGFKAELDEIFNLRSMKEAIHRSLCELGVVADEYWERNKADMEENWFDLKISLEKLKVDFEALSFHYSEKREVQLAEIAILIDLLVEMVHQTDVIRRADVYGDVQILFLKFDTAKERLQVLKTRGAHLSSDKASFESAWYELRTTFNSIAKLLA
jgi:hypothetical protein